MQKIINILAIVSFVGTASIIGGGFYLYSQKDALIEEAKKRATEEVMKVVPDMIGNLMPEIPEVPSATGAAIPF
tara:strand:+ start:401 stop:622 length:222 start_codon:yes stop_codon:yes gene_type:complete